MRGDVYNYYYNYLGLFCLYITHTTVHALQNVICNFDIVFVI